MGLLWWVIRDTPLGVLWENLRSASFLGIVAGAAVQFGHNVFRVWRWRLLLEPVRPGLAFRPMFAAVVVGYMTSWTIPGRLGELVRPMLLSARENVPLGPAIGSVVADRLFDAACVIVLFAAGSWITPFEGRAAEHVALIRTGSIGLAISVVLFLALMITISVHSVAMTGWLERRGRILRWIGRTTIALSSGVQALRSPWRAFRVGVLSLMAWLTVAAGSWVSVRAAGAEVSFGGMLVILPILVLGIAIPTPGGAGSYHGAMKVGLMLLGVTEALSVSTGLLVHASVTIPVILLGVVLIWTERVSWRDLLAAARQVRKLGEGVDPRGQGRTVESLS